jgi:hypothetical protein
VTSSGQNDPGLFEANFRDERYLPFEGAGAISDWSLELPNDFRSFDYDTISDVILHIRYTAREAGGSLKTQALVELQDAINTVTQEENEQGLARLFSLRHEFPTEWHRFLNPVGTTSPNAVTLTLTKDRFPFLFQGKTVQIDQLEVYIKVATEFVGTHNQSTLTVSLEQGTSTSGTAMSMSDWNGLLFAQKENIGWQTPTVAEGSEWTLTAWRDTTQRVDPSALEDIYVVGRYRIL